MDQKAKKEANRKVRAAAAYIRKQAKKYGKTVSFSGRYWKNI